MDPTQTAAAATKAADFYLTQGVLGVTCFVLALVVVVQWRKNEAQGAAITALVKEISVALQANTAATMAGTMATKGLETTLDAFGRGIDGLSRQVEVSQAVATERGGQIIENQKTILARQEGIIGRLSERLK